MKYLVMDCAGDDMETIAPRIVNADSESDAIRRYQVDHLAHTPMIHEFVEDSTEACGFAYAFWPRWAEEAGMMEDPARRAEAEREQEEGVLRFFGDRRDYADLYLTHLKARRNDASVSLDAPPEFYAYIVMNFEDYADLVAVPVSEIEITA